MDRLSDKSYTLINWLDYNKVELVDTFIDRGRSAKTFDRPDFIKLQEFITKHHKYVYYLLANQFVEENTAKVINFIYDSFLRNLPLYKIKELAKKLGFKRGGNMAIERISTNPVYAGMVEAKSLKNIPGGLFPGIHEPIIDKTTWFFVQSKMKKPEKVRTYFDDNIPF